MSTVAPTEPFLVQMPMFNAALLRTIFINEIEKWHLAAQPEWPRTFCEAINAMNDPDRYVDLMPREWKSDRPKQREPIFGPNAKPWFISFTIALVCALYIHPWLRGEIKPYTDPAVEAAFDTICTSIDWCTPEASVRLGRSTDR